MVAGVNRRAGSTGDGGTAIHSGKAASALAVRFPSDKSCCPQDPRTSTDISGSLSDRGLAFPGPTPITKTRSRSSFSVG